MKYLKKLKSANLWVSVISAGVLIAEGVFDFEIKTEYLSQILLGIMGLLTMFGIVSDHGNKEVIISNTEKSSEKTVSEHSENGISNIKSICDTINLLLNNLTINSKDKTSESYDDTLIEMINSMKNIKADNQNNAPEENKKEENCKDTSCNENEEKNNLPIYENKIDNASIAMEETKTEDKITELSDEIVLNIIN